METWMKAFGLIILGIAILAVRASAGQWCRSLRKTKVLGRPLGNGQDQHEQGLARFGAYLRRHRHSRKAAHG